MDYEPITKGLRESLDDKAPYDDFGVWVNKGELLTHCDTIDAIHASLEQENERLRERLQELDNADGSMQIGEVAVTITPRIDWTAVADDLRDAAKALCERTREGE